jgi:nucleoside 2-deoxyribosyltransferase
MKIYFFASNKHKRQFSAIYTRIITHLKNQGHEVFSKSLSQHLPDLSEVSTSKAKAWYKEWSEIISQCDLAITEATYPSTVHIGFELGMIVTRGKPVIVLHKSDQDPVFINNNYSNKIIKSEYEQDNLEEIIDWCLEETDGFSTKRFTFYISQEIDEFLDKISENKDLNKSEYIRKLIEDKMKDNQ